MGEQARDIGAIAHKLGLQEGFERAGFATHASARPTHAPARSVGGSRNSGRSRNNRR
jgi:hypothetical protein